MSKKKHFYLLAIFFATTSLAKAGPDGLTAEEFMKTLPIRDLVISVDLFYRCQERGLLGDELDRNMIFNTLHTAFPYEEDAVLNTFLDRLIAANNATNAQPR